MNIIIIIFIIIIIIIIIIIFIIIIYRQLGFCEFSENGIPLNPIHWFQFADDAAVITGQEKENQILLNRFTVWCQWAHIIIRVDK